MNYQDLYDSIYNEIEEQECPDTFIRVLKWIGGLILAVIVALNGYGIGSILYIEWHNSQDMDVAKPVIYLYPMEELDVSVMIDGVDLTTTYPEYVNGWNVTAYPNGMIVDRNGREYNYLYWEGVDDNFVDISQGFVVEKENYIKFLETKLEEVGLNDKESGDFITYWLPQMNEYEYCLVSFQMENYDEEVSLDFSVEPENELRVFVTFKGLDEMIEIEEQDLSYYKGFDRDGFTVVEWGGTFLK